MIHGDKSLNEGLERDRWPLKLDRRTTGIHHRMGFWLGFDMRCAKGWNGREQYARFMEHGICDVEVGTARGTGGIEAGLAEDLWAVGVWC